MSEQATPDCSAADYGSTAYWFNTYIPHRFWAHAHGGDAPGFSRVHASEGGRDVWAFLEALPDAQ